VDYLEAGNPERDPIVLLHGMGTGASAWQPQLDALSESYHVLAPFLPGYGSSPGLFNLSEAREAVASLIEKRVQAPVHLCGLSLGALVALDVAHTHPKLVRSLVLSAGFVFLSKEMIEQRRASAKAIRTFEPSTFADKVLPQLIQDVPESFQMQALQEIGGLTPESLAGLIALEFDARDWIYSISAPALVLCGDKDEINLPLSQELAEQLPRATFETVPSAGHVANLDAPEAFTSKLQRFVQIASR
jgi:3-oxoadipate enol-lactonase